jgi:hypothetical protein
MTWTVLRKCARTTTPSCFMVIGSLTENQNILWIGKLHMYVQSINIEWSVMGRHVFDWKKYFHYATRIFANIFQ